MKKRIQYFTIFIMLISLELNSWATHNRAGEITYRWISGYTYEITVTTFTYVLSLANRPQLEVQWGDGTSMVVNRIEQIVLPNLYYRNKYVAQHSYPGPGTYRILMQDPNRNLGIRNIPNSVNVIFSIETSLIVNPILGESGTPQLLNPPIDKGAVGHKFIHNPAAYDPDGDSLTYRLTPCTEENGMPIKGYTLPLSRPDSIFIDSHGNLTWNAPVDTGFYNIAFLIEKWKNGIKLAAVERDMQINIYRTNNEPPVIDTIGNICVVEGSTVEQDIHITDPNNDSILAIAAGGPFIIGPDSAHFTLIKSRRGNATYHFKWTTDCNHVRDLPYQVLIKATDTLTDISLSTFRFFYVHVIGKKPENVIARPGSSSMLLTWSPVSCTNVIGYQIYRKVSPSNFIPDSCETGIPSSAGFVLAGKTNSRLDTLFNDDNNGQGLTKGNIYCYRVVAIYPSGAKSIASDEFCTVLVPGLPALLQVSVDKIGVTDGTIRVSWVKPLHLDTIPANGPYKYVIYRSPDLYGNSLVAIDSFNTIDLNDTVYLDKNINTTIYPYSYKVALYNNAPGDYRLLGRQEIASSLALKLVGKDKEIFIDFIKNVPWINTRYIVYRQNPVTSAYDSIGFTDTARFVDLHLKNGVNYCYQAKSIGYRNNGGLEYTNFNFSHPACTVPVDTIPPCPPILTVSSLCDSFRNILVWTNPNHSCANDVIGYRIYYSSNLANDPILLDSIIGNPNDTTYIHHPKIGLAGCYAVSAIDSARNESKHSAKMCIDDCAFYKLPNVFTPNGDSKNDVFYAINPNGYVQKVDMKIYNRWGQLVYHTTDPLINWDGRLLGTNTIVSPGVYYYICDVYEPRLTGLEARNIVGFIYVFTDKKTVPNEQ
jgi:gliding motility-associated-like protein